MTGVRLKPTYLTPPDAHPSGGLDELTLVALGSTEEYSGGAENLAVAFAGRIAEAWGFFVDTAEVITSHLVARAVEITGVPHPPPRFAEVMKDPPPLVGVRLRRIRPGLLIEAWDSASGQPIPPDPQCLDDHLSAVRQLCGAWGWYRAPDGGKVIWAKLFHLTQPMPLRSAGHYTYPELDPPITACTDAPLMRRTVDGLQQQINTARKGTTWL